MKIVVFASLWACLAANAFSQSTGDRVGFEFSPTIVTVVMKDADYTLRPGFSLLARYEVPVSEGFRLVTGLGYAQKGLLAKYEGNYEGPFTSRYNVNLNYATVPVMVRASLEPSGRFFAEGGLYGAYLMGARSRSETRDGKESNGVTSFHRRFDFGASIGFGVEVPRGGSSLNIEIRSQLGLRGLYDSPGATAAYNLTLGAVVAWMFP